MMAVTLSRHLCNLILHLSNILLDLPLHIVEFISADAFNNLIIHDSENVCKFISVGNLLTISEHFLTIISAQLKR